MAHVRDLYKTKLCTLYQRGNCPRHICSFAHGDAELRRFSGGGGFNGRQENHRDGDVWDRSDRRRTSSHRRHSSSREGRGGRQRNSSDKRLSPRDRGRSHSRSSLQHSRTTRSLSPQRSPYCKSDRRESKRTKLEPQDVHLSDVSDHYNRDIKFEEEDNARPLAKSPCPNIRDAIFDQLHQVQLKNEVLLGNKSKLEKYLGKMKEEQGIISAKNAELESKLNNSQDEVRRWNSKVKKVVKLYLRNVRAKEEVKKTQARLQKFAEDFLTEENHRQSTHDNDSDDYNLSHIEPDWITNGVKTERTFACHTMDMDAEGTATRKYDETHDEQDVTTSHDSVAIARKRRLHAVREKTRALTQKMQQNGGNIRLKTKEDESHLDLEMTSTIMPSGEGEKPNEMDMFMLIEGETSKERMAMDNLSRSPCGRKRWIWSLFRIFKTGLIAPCFNSHDIVHSSLDLLNFFVKSFGLIFGASWNASTILDESHSKVIDTN